jgi:hypothetical protein
MPSITSAAVEAKPKRVWMRVGVVSVMRGVSDADFFDG